MSSDPTKIIDQYLERVRVYLPLGSEDTLVEIRTHIMEEAERIGEGRLTAGSVMLAIERLGDPKAIANEYAGTGKTKGLIPVEYISPLIRLLIVLIGVTFCFTVVSQIIGQVFSSYLGEITYLPVLLPFTVGINFVIALVILTGISLLDRSALPTEKTPLESFLGIGVEGFKPKPKTDAAGELITGVAFGIALLVPQIQLVFSVAFQPFLTLVSLVSFFGALKGAFFLAGGENNITLLSEVVVSSVWATLALLIVNIPWPLQYAWVFVNGMWTLVDMNTITGMIPFPIFDFLWLFVILITVTVSIWRIIVNLMKVSTFLKQKRGWWWQGAS